MQIVTSEQMQKIDHDAINVHGIPGLSLMERAGDACAEAINCRFGVTEAKSALIVAGKGNNGGDGYVIARRLHSSGWEVTVIVVADRVEITGDAAVNLDRLPEGVTINFCSDPDSLEREFTNSVRYTVVVDALLGTGLKNEVAGVHLKAIEVINASNGPVVAVDIPSGLHGSTGIILGGAVRADLTITFAAAKLGHLLYPGAALIGELVVVDIGIPAEVMDQAKGYEFIDAEAARVLLRPRSPVSHKGSFGHALILAGSTGHTGAAALAAAATVRSGIGLVTLAVPSSLNHILEIKTTEAMTLPLDDVGRGYLAAGALPQIIAGLEGKDAIAIGPGLSRERETSALVQSLVATVTLPMVIDADGLNAISENISVLEYRESSVMILTPHPGEMARLADISVREVEADRIGVARCFATKHRVYLVLKGARTVIASPEGKIAINGSGNPGMASGGMGDVLTGLITSLLCQGYPPFDACRLGVFIHGYSADLMAGEKGEIGITATDVIENLPRTFKRLLTRSLL
jgi:NAD(P)H-hydrate epimerase